MDVFDKAASLCGGGLVDQFTFLNENLTLEEVTELNRKYCLVLKEVKKVIDPEISAREKEKQFGSFPVQV